MSAAPQATVIFPPHSFIDPINIKDSINVTYKSAWQFLNLTVLCIGSPNSNNLLYHNIDGNPIQGTGSYMTPSIDSMGFGIEQYPTQCKIRLTQYGDNNVKADGGDFILTSINDKAAATYEQTTTIFPTQTSISNRTLIATDTHTPPSPPQRTTISPSSSSTTFAFPSLTSTSTSRSSSSSPPSSSTSTSSTSFHPANVTNKETSAAIGIGVALAAVLTIFISLWIFFLARRRRRRKAMTGRLTMTTATKTMMQSTSDDLMHGKAELCGHGTFVPPSRRTPCQYHDTSPLSPGRYYGKEINSFSPLSQAIVSPIYQRTDGCSQRAFGVRNEGGRGGDVSSRYELECRVKDNRPRHELEGVGGVVVPPKTNFSRPRHELA